MNVEILTTVEKVSKTMLESTAYIAKAERELSSVSDKIPEVREASSILDSVHRELFRMWKELELCRAVNDMMLDASELEALSTLESGERA